jgi:hypothetical protein
MRRNGVFAKRARSVRRASLVALAAVAVCAAAALPGAQAGTTTDPIVTHKFFPLDPGTTFTYKSNEGKTTYVKVTHQTKTIQGHVSQEVTTKEYEGGNLTEHFVDWYFQGAGGTVYYMKHKSTRPGESWQAGKDGAKKGIIMEADPQEGDTYSQTRAPNAGREGVDKAKVYSVSNKTVKIKISSSRYSETVRFYYTKNVGLTQIKDKSEVTTLKSVGKP